ncbi:MAG: zinc-ribbon domain-containing protein, partial [Deltaproteobacteria bacterium]|nr:zinc-ribbon domain-containing protein [Deltaproteobacteria bacterium]
MRIACEQCGTAYEVDPGQIPATGMSIKCTVCFHSFTIMPPGDAAIGIELSDDGSDMQLSNDPTDIPQAPVGYVDPTNLSIEGPGNIGLADLPGLPRSPAQP